MTQITFIGGGNMATSIIGGLIKQETLSPNLIHVSDPNEDQRSQLAETFGIHTHADNLDAVKDAQVVVMAVKPQMMQAVLTSELKAYLSQQQPLLISIAAGIDIDSLAHWSSCRAIVRCMPNTPALVGEGATGLFACDEVSIEQRNLTDSLLQSVGLTVWVENEADIDAVTAVSGSGPAYYFLMMEAMIEAAETLGLSKENATKLTLKTALGASQMALSSQEPPAELRRRVTSPGGTTERALQTFEQAQYREIVSDALKAAQQRAQELSHEMGAALEKTD